MEEGDRMTRDEAVEQLRQAGLHAFARDWIEGKSVGVSSRVTQDHGINCCYDMIYLCSVGERWRVIELDSPESEIEYESLQSAVDRTKSRLLKRIAMRLTIKLFGPEARAVGNHEIVLDGLELPMSCADLRARLLAREPRLAKSLKTARFAVNHDFVSDDAVVNAGDEIALIGSVSGG